MYRQTLAYTFLSDSHPHFMLNRGCQKAKRHGNEEIRTYKHTSMLLQVLGVFGTPIKHQLLTITCANLIVPTCAYMLGNKQNPLHVSQMPSSHVHWVCTLSVHTGQ